jgi:hypothetical protein
MIQKLKYLLLTLIIFQGNVMFGQNEIDPDEINGRELSEDFNILKYVVPFLTIAPDSRAGGMGDVGAATTPDANSTHWNPAKFAMIDQDGGISLTYTPWLRNLVNDINLLYLSGFYRIDQRQVIAGSLLYFSLGEIIFTNEQGGYQGQHTPNEFALDMTYASYLTEKLSMGVAFRFIRSDLTGGGVFTSAGTESQPGKSFAADFSLYYETPVTIDDKESELAFGLAFTNMGSKLSYSIDNQGDDFIPANLRLGSRLTMDLDEYNSLSFAFDISKVLVPTTPVYHDSIENKVIAGKDPNVSPAQGMIQSFYDAPGGFREEMHELIYSLGAEYWYSKQFALRGGYFHEHQTKGNRKYLTLGLGFKLNVLSMDFAYLVPTSGRQNPLANTMRFTLLFNFDNFNQN